MKVKLSKGLQEEFISFLENHPPQQFSSRLRSMIFEYMRYELKAGTTPLDFDDFLWSLNDLFDLLDKAAKEFPQAAGERKTPATA
jgi:hypothetical protein